MAYDIEFEAGPTPPIVKIGVRLDDSTLVMEIEDEGDGFDWNGATDKEPDITEDHGRGISIMTHYFSEFRYNASGTKLTLIKRLED